MRRIILLAIALAVFPNPSHAEVIARCGASEGWSYYLPGGAVPPGDSGWQKDQISDGTIELIIDNRGVDIRYRSAKNESPLSLRDDDGAEVTVVAVDEAIGDLIVVAVHKGSPILEHFFFRLRKDGGEVLWGGARAGSLIAKAHLFRAPCQSPRRAE